MPQDNHQLDQSSLKRAAEELRQRPARSKRSRYVNKACHECKRRKLKCDGEEPCERCLSQDTDCVYAPGLSHAMPDWSDFQRIHTEMQSMRGNLEQVMRNLTPRNSYDDRSLDTTVYPAQVSALQRPALIPESPIREGTSQHPLTEYSPRGGPTSSRFAFEMARERLQSLGLDSVEAEPWSHEDQLDFASFSPYRMFDLGNVKALLEKDPLCHMDEQEVSRLINVWSNGIGKLFPVVDVPNLHARWESLHAMLTSTRTDRSTQKYLATIEVLLDGETHLLKLVLANSLTAGSGGMNETAKRLFDSVGGAPQAAFTEVPTLRNINMLMLVGILYYHLDDEMRANRVISLAVRLCFEMGLHRSETYQRNIKDENEQAAAVAAFWSVYVLERRSSIGLGVPFIMQDSEIDVSLPRPSKHLYLEAMVGFTKLAGQVCRRTSTLRDRSITFPVEEIEYQDYKVLQWQRQLCPDLTLDISDLGQNLHPQLEMSTVPYTYVAIVLHARAQELRSLIYRPVLYSTARIAENKSHAQMAVDIARESVQFLALTSRTTTFAIDEPLFFRDFLISHLAGILLAVSNAPADFGHQLGDEFYLVLDVLRSLSSRSPVIARVWNSVKILEIAGPKLGLNRAPQSTQSQNVDRASLDRSHLPNLQDGERIVRAEPETLMPMTSMLIPTQPDADETTFGPRDFTFSTSMFPTQLRNELSMMNEPLGDILPNLVDYGFTDDIHLNTCWR